VAKKTPTDDRRILRAEAEARFARAAPPGAPHPPTSELMHELQVHQVELEMQNEELRRVQVALEISRDRYLDLYDFAPVGYLTLSDSGLIEDANLTVAGLLGLERGKLRGRRFAGFVGPEDADRWHRLLSTLLRGEESSAFDLALRRGDGSTFDARLGCRRQEGRGAGSSLRVVLTDVTARKHDEAALRASEDHFRVLVQALPIPVAFSNRHQEITTLNRKFTRVLGYTGEDIPDLDAWFRRAYPDESYRRQVEETWGTALRKATAEGGEVPPNEFRVTCKSGDERTVLISGIPVGESLLVTLIDVTEQRALQAQVALASRLAAMGTLVAGVAHEINNPLAAELAGQELALAAVQGVMAHLDGDAPIDRKAEACVLGEVIEELSEAQESGRRIEAIVKALQTFGRVDSKRSRVRLGDVVEQALRWLPPAVGQSTVVQVENGGAPEILASFGQIEQVVVNLVVNARKAAVPGRSNPIAIRIGPGAPGMARLEVADQGRGMDPATLDRVFEPFFTNGVIGKGMGLGLAVSHELVAAHGGILTAESVLGRGSTFRVELPAAPTRV
jgi:PAS domain S-box-containing protein